MIVPSFVVPYSFLGDIIGSICFLSNEMTPTTHLADDMVVFFDLLSKGFDALHGTPHEERNTLDPPYCLLPEIGMGNSLRLAGQEHIQPGNTCAALQAVPILTLTLPTPELPRPAAFNSPDLATAPSGPNTSYSYLEVVNQDNIGEMWSDVYRSKTGVVESSWVEREQDSGFLTPMLEDTPSDGYALALGRRRATEFKSSRYGEYEPGDPNPIVGEGVGRTTDSLGRMGLESGLRVRRTKTLVVGASRKARSQNGMEETQQDTKGEMKLERGQGRAERIWGWIRGLVHGLVMRRGRVRRQRSVVDRCQEVLG